MAAAGLGPRSTGLAAEVTGLETGELTVIHSRNIPDIDPHFAYDSGASLILRAVYEPLFRPTDADPTVMEGVLAQGWAWSEESRVLTVWLRPDVTFHDGSACTAVEVVGSFHRLLQQGEGPVGVVGRFIRDIARIRTVGPMTVRFELDKPAPRFLAALASPYGAYIINPADMNGHISDHDPFAHEWMREHVNGTGPYRMDTFIGTDRVEVKRFDEHWQGWARPHFERVRVLVRTERGDPAKELENGNADAASDQLSLAEVETLSSQAPFRLVVSPSSAVSWTIMNTPRLGSVEARQGMSHAFPYERVVTEAYAGRLVRTGPLPRSVLGYDPDVFLYPTDLAAAKRLLEAGGFAEGAEFEYLVAADDEIEEAVARFFKESLEEIGYGLLVIKMEQGSLLEQVYGTTDPSTLPHFIGGWTWWPDYNDPLMQLKPNFASSPRGERPNAGFYANADVDALLERVAEAATDDEIVRQAIQVQRLLTRDDPPVIYHGEVQRTTIIRSEIDGFQPNPLLVDAYPFERMHRAMLLEPRD